MSGIDKTLPVASVSIGELDKRYVNDCLARNWITAGKYVKQLEREFAKYVECKHAVAVNNGTAALHLALLASGVGVGDEVIIPTLTYIATANAVSYCGARPVFVDADPNTWNIDTTGIESAITDKTVAILPVHLYGLPAEMDSIRQIAAKHGLRVIEDASEAHGALYRGRKVGRLSSVATFSFFGNKIITSGEGGIITTNDLDIADKCLLFRNQGQVKGQRYRHSVIGYNYRMTDLQAAVGVAQLARIEEILGKKEQIAGYYSERMNDMVGIELQASPADEKTKRVHWLITALFSTNLWPEQKEIMSYLASKGIETRPVFYPLHLQEPYLSDGGGELPVSQSISSTGISLPSGTDLTEADVDRVVKALTSLSNLYWGGMSI